MPFSESGVCGTLAAAIHRSNPIWRLFMAEHVPTTLLVAYADRGAGSGHGGAVAGAGVYTCGAFWGRKMGKYWGNWIWCEWKCDWREGIICS